jgi:pyruvate/2-oxoglutarate/acetoin dehydrogenase E1 component
MLEAVRNTGRVLVLTEDCRTAGTAAEIISLITDHAFGALQAAPVRVSAQDCPLPYSGPLEASALPSPGGVARALRTLIRG